MTTSKRECDQAQNTVSVISAKNVKGTVENLSKAYQHAKICPDCSVSLGSFLEDLIKQLGVNLPNVKKTDPSGAQYQGAKSDKTTTSPGPGTVRWSPEEGGAGYRVVPTEGSLAATVAVLEDKLRLKDHMIRSLADELLAVTGCPESPPWNPTPLLTEVGLPSPTLAPDFDRRRLVTYLKSESPHSLATPQEASGEEEVYAATNPLGLTVVRQVGHDSLLVQWKPPAPEKLVHAFEIFVNGLFVQRINSPGRTKALIHPIDLEGKVFLTLTALTYTGRECDSATIST